MNNTSTASASDAVRNRRLLILGVLLIVVAIAITASRLIHSRMQQARLVQDRPADLQWGTKVYSLVTADKAQETRAKYLAKASLLRDHWRVWAVAHQDLLRQLRQAPPDDHATLIRVYSALPALSALASPSNPDASAGVTLADVQANSDDFLSERGVLFTWQPGPLKTHVQEAMLRSDPQAQVKNDQSDIAYRGKLQRDFANYRGIMLSESMSSGSSQITLWADGRITEMTHQRQHIIGKPICIDGPEKQIVPAYDFLK